MPANHKDTDSAMWQREFNRSLQAIKGSLHSLRLQAANSANSSPLRQDGAKQMAHTFEMVEIAFQALNTEEPAPSNPDADPIPAPAPRGRRQFISDLKAGQ